MESMWPLRILALVGVPAAVMVVGAVPNIHANPRSLVLLAASTCILGLGALAVAMSFRASGRAVMAVAAVGFIALEAPVVIGVLLWASCMATNVCV